MKRSRACEDLRALECSATESDADADCTGQPHFHHTQHLFRRIKRARRAVDMVVDTDFSDLEELSEDVFAAFRLDAGAAAAAAAAAAVVGVSSSSSSSTSSCSSTSSASVDDCDFVDRFASSYERLALPPIRRNSRDALPVVECDAVSLAALQFKKKLQLAAEPMMLVDAVDVPETDLLGRFPFEKRQAFASLFMLPVNPNR